MPTLRMSFSGLCMFVFDPPLEQADQTLKEATVLLQRLTRARMLSNQVHLQPEVLDQHFPLLEFNLADYQPQSTRKADFHCFPDASGKMTKGACLLIGEELTILPNGQPMISPINFSKAAPPDPADPQLTQEQQESLFWMATLQDALGDRAPLNPRLIENPPASNEPILARVHLTYGRLKTLELTDLPFTIGGTTIPSALNRRIATALELEAYFPTTVVFRMVARRNGETKERELVLAPPPGSDELRIGISNMEIDRFIGMDPSAGPRVEADFEVFSDLLEKPIERGQPRPFLLQASAGSSSGQGGVSGCVPPRGSTSPPTS